MHEYARTLDMAKAYFAKAWGGGEAAWPAGWCRG